MSSEQQALLMAGDAGGPSPVPSCVGDPYYTCGPGLGLWTEVAAPFLSLWSGSTTVVAPNGNLVALGFNNTGSFAAYSYLSTDDGATWTQTAQAVNAEYRTSAVGADRIVCVAGNSATSNRCAVSTDNGVTWTHYTSMPSGQYWYGLAFGNGKFIAGAYGSSTLATSTNGVTWSTQATSMSGVDCLAYGAGTWIAGYRNSTDVWRSTNDGVTWSSVSVAGAAPIRATHCGGRFFLFNSGAATNGIRHSSDGITWSTTHLPLSVSVLAVSYTGTQYVCLGWVSGGAYYVFFSSDLITWSWWEIAASGSDFTTETVLTASGLLIAQGFRDGKSGSVNTANGAGPRTVLSIHADIDPPTDFSCYQTKTLTLTGSAVVSAAQSQFGGKSILVPNVGTSTLNGLVVTDHQDFDFSTGDLTIDLLAYRSADTYVGTLFYGTLGGGEFSVKVGTDGLIDLTYRSSGGSQSFTNVATWPVGQWVYFVVQRRGTNWETYLDGALIHSAAITGGAGSTVNSGGDLFFGRTNASSAETWNGYLDDIRVTRGAARYTSAFTPPTLTFCESTIDGFIYGVDGAEALCGVSTTSSVGTLRVADVYAALTSISTITATGSLVPAPAPFPNMFGFAEVTDNFGTLQFDAPVTVWHEFKTDGTIWRKVFSNSTTPLSNTQVGLWIDNTNSNYTISTITGHYTFSATATIGSTGVFTTTSYPPVNPDVLIRAVSGLGFVAPCNFNLNIVALPKSSNPRYGESGYFTSFRSIFTLSQPAPAPSPPPAPPQYPNFVNITQTNLYATARPVYMRFEFNVDGTFQIVDQDSFVHYSGTWIINTTYTIADIIADYQIASISIFVGGSRVSWGNLPVPGPMPNGFSVTVQNVPQVSIVPFDFQVSIVPTSSNPRYGEFGYAGIYRFSGQLEDLV